MRGDARPGEGGRVTATVVAAASAVALVAALVAFVLDGSRDTEAAADQAARPTAVSSASVSPTPSSGPSPSASPSRAAEPKHEDTGRPEKKRRPKREARPEPEPVVPSVYVEVYNMTTVEGLAASKAALLQDIGWQVVGIDNWRGNIPASTVYYPDGMADEATRLANTLGIGRVRGAVAPMRFDRLTVILTADAV